MNQQATAQRVLDDLGLATRRWREREEISLKDSSEHYIRECLWCDATYRCNLMHRDDLRPAYALCVHCSGEYMRLHEALSSVLNPDYDTPTYWPFPEASI